LRCSSTTDSKHLTVTALRHACQALGNLVQERAALGIDDKSRTAKVLSGIVGKRLTYRQLLGHLHSKPPEPHKKQRKES
jgi:hypothetical protein